jgi:ribosomal protein L11 methyltransferase
MSQVRLYFTLARASSRSIYSLIDAAFEDNGYPLSVFEIEDERELDEISVYVDGEEADAAKARLTQLVKAELPDLAIGQEEIPDIDWVAHTLEALRPVRAGRFLVHGAHDRDKVRAGDIGIEIEAGLAFGTGHHGTTSSCLELITGVVQREHPRNALDLGTGSAVLAIALARLARIPVLATDIDKVAVTVAADNVRLNKASAYVTTAHATGFDSPVFARSGPFDLIVANILARPLMALAPQMARHLAPNGSLILSGILERQRNAVISAYVTQGFRHVKTLHREGWVGIHLKR